MSECMPIPDNWKDFVKEYSFKDKEEIYTNGSELIPVFRVEQMMEHYLVEKQVAEYKAKIKFYPKHPDKYGYTDTFQCSGCGDFVFTPYPLYKECEFKFCPHCGGSVE